MISVWTRCELTRFKERHLIATSLSLPILVKQNNQALTPHTVMNAFNLFKSTFFVLAVSHTCLQWAFFLDSWEDKKNADKRDWFVGGDGPHKLHYAPWMSTKPSCRPVRHWMGLSSGDNRLSIRDRGNNTRVSRRAVNHYLSVRRPWLHTVPSSFTLLSASIPLFLMVHSEVACFASCCYPQSYLLFMQTFTLSMQLFRGDISPFKTTEWVVPILKVSPCHQPIVTQHLAPHEGQVLVSFPERHTCSHVCG